MTTNQNPAHDPDEDLQPFDLEIINPAALDGGHVAGLLTSYSTGDIRIVALGRHATFEAAIVPAQAYQRLLGYDERPDIDLSTVPIIHPEEISFGGLTQHLDRFAAGDTTPAFFGTTPEPGAVIITAKDFMRLFKNDHTSYVRSEKAFAGTVTDRIQRTDEDRASGTYQGTTIHSDEDLEQWAIDSFGEAGRIWVEERHQGDDRA